MLARHILFEGFWHTAAGLHADEVRRIVLTARAEAVVTDLADRPALWGGSVSDERFMVTSRS